MRCLTGVSYILMYQLFNPDFSISDIERFTELSIRRGIPLSSLIAADPKDRRIVAGAALLGEVGKNPSTESLLDALRDFLSGPGDWLKASPEELLDAAKAEGVVDEQGGAANIRLEPRPGVTAARLLDDLEAARVILEERRARMKETLQKKNREANAPKRPSGNPEEDVRFMKLALEEARRAGEAGEIPVGAVVVEDGRVLGKAGNETLRTGDPTAHAEVLALRRAASAAGNHRLTQTTLYVTLEPCPMCAGAISEARCARIVYGAGDPRRGALAGAFRLFDIPGVNHRPVIEGGVLGEEGEALMRDFFARRRKEKTQS